jgi:hypothetical protein
MSGFGFLGKASETVGGWPAAIVSAHQPSAPGRAVRSGVMRGSPASPPYTDSPLGALRNGAKSNRSEVPPAAVAAHLRGLRPSDFRQASPSRRGLRPPHVSIKQKLRPYFLLGRDAESNRSAVPPQAVAAHLRGLRPSDFRRASSSRRGQRPPHVSTKQKPRPIGRGFCLVETWGVEPQTYSLRTNRSTN